MAVDWSLVKRARWLPVGDEGIVMAEYRVIGIRGRMLFVPWVQHDVCSAWYPLDGGWCLFCGKPVVAS